MANIKGMSWLGIQKRNREADWWTEEEQAMGEEAARLEPPSVGPVKLVKLGG